MPQSDRSTLLTRLTRREHDIFQLVVQGKSSAHISTVMGISLHTVKQHRRNILHKLEVPNVAALATLMLHRTKLIPKPLFATRASPPASWTS